MSQKSHKVLNQTYGNLDAVLLNPRARDNVCDPYIKLKNRCLQLGYTFEDINRHDLADARWLVFWDAWLPGARTPVQRALMRARIRKAGGTSRNTFREALRRGLDDKLVLFMYEPPSVCPNNFNLEVHKHFSTIFTWDPDLVDNQKYFRIYLPNSTNFASPSPGSFAEKKLLVDISSYKYFDHERGLNDERRRTVRYFETHYPNDFDLFGYGWNPSFVQYLRKRLMHRTWRREQYPSYKGPIESKADVLPHYKFSLCYENILDQKGYVSIKIFDSLRLGCVPVYLGAPDIGDYVDREAFVDRRQFGSIEELGRYLSSVGPAEHEQYLSAGRRYLDSDSFRRFLDDNFVDTIVKVLQLEHHEAI